MRFEEARGSIAISKRWRRSPRARSAEPRGHREQSRDRRGRGRPRLAHVVLERATRADPPLAEAGDAYAIAEFVAVNYERYRARPVVRDELDAMAIVARWLSERDRADGRLMHLRGPSSSPPHCGRPPSGRAGETAQS